MEKPFLQDQEKSPFVNKGWKKPLENVWSSKEKDNNLKANLIVNRFKWLELFFKSYNCKEDISYTFASSHKKYWGIAKHDFNIIIQACRVLKNYQCDRGPQSTYDCKPSLTHGKPTTAAVCSEQSDVDKIWISEEDILSQTKGLPKSWSCLQWVPPVGRALKNM